MQSCAFAPSTVFTRGTAVRARVPAQRRGFRMVTQAKVIKVYQDQFMGRAVQKTLFVWARSPRVGRSLAEGSDNFGQLFIFFAGIDVTTYYSICNIVIKWSAVSKTGPQLVFCDDYAGRTGNGRIVLRKRLGGFGTD